MKTRSQTRAEIKEMTELVEMMEVFEIERPKDEMEIVENDNITYTFETEPEIEIVDPSKKKSRYIMIFDVETNGLLSRVQKPIELCPQILQLSFIIYDEANNETVRIFNEYVDVDDSVEIPEDTIKINGITREKCKELGRPIEYILDEFYNEYMRCETIVAHNIDFDSRMVKIEIMRHSSSMLCIDPSVVFNLDQNIDRKIYCTMLHGVNLCNIPGRYGKKWPTLLELHLKIFGCVPDGLHDALVDTKACFECYKILIKI
jgi:DNA polymerase III alpha subunit (gram-positive type)